MSGEPRNIHVTREDQQFGPYPEDVAKQFLAEGKLLASDLAWHLEADGWKPLGEVLGPTQNQDDPPLPPPAPSKAPSPNTKVHISRKGERHGPYSYATVNEYLTDGRLLPTDSAWHDGMGEWKPLGELMGSDVEGTCPRCSTKLDANTVTTCNPGKGYKLSQF